MGKKGKGKSKLSRMTDEERARYLQHRADMEEEARRRKQLLIALFMKNKLHKEEAFSRLNMAKINQEWRTILRQIKCKDLQNEIHLVREECEEIIDRKNTIVQRLLTDLDENEEMYCNMISSHIARMKALIDIYNQRLQFFNHNYQLNTTDLVDHHINQSEHSVKQQEYLIHSLEKIHFCKESKQNEVEHKIDIEYQQRLDLLKTQLLINMEEIQLTRENEMKQLWSDFQNILSSYLERTNDIHNEYLEMKQHDDEESIVIQHYYSEIDRCNNTILDYKNDLEIIRDEQNHKMNNLLAQRNKLHDKYMKLKANIVIQLKTDKQMIRNMAVASNATLQHLRGLYKQGQSAANIYEMSYKLYTVSEKTQNILVLREKRESSNFNLDTLWVQLNNAKVDIECLTKDRKQLMKQESELKLQIKKYLSSYILQNGGSDELGRNHLRPTSTKIENIIRIDLNLTGLTKESVGENKRKSRPITSIEGNMSVAVRSKQLLKVKRRPATHVINRNFTNF